MKKGHFQKRIVHAKDVSTRYDTQPVIRLNWLAAAKGDGNTT